jgi:hypothetical protein
MRAPGQYDGTMQMFVEAPRAPDVSRLRFLRWLAERDLLEHAVAGPATGQYAPSARPDAGNARTPTPYRREDRLAA